MQAAEGLNLSTMCLARTYTLLPTPASASAMSFIKVDNVKSKMGITYIVVIKSYRKYSHQNSCNAFTSVFVM